MIKGTHLILKGSKKLQSCLFSLPITLKQYLKIEFENQKDSIGYCCFPCGEFQIIAWFNTSENVFEVLKIKEVK